MTALNMAMVVDHSELPEYPIPKGERLESHYFFEFHYHRWLSSDTRLLADLDVRGVFLDLVCISQDQSPVGTLPENPRLLAKLVGITQEEFERLCHREISPLHKWEPCMCGDERRLHHPVVTELAVKAFTSKTKNAQSKAEDRERKRLKGIATILRSSIEGGQYVAKSDERIEAINDWIKAEYPGGSATVKRVKEALDSLTTL